MHRHLIGPALAIVCVLLSAPSRAAVAETAEATPSQPPHQPGIVGPWSGVSLAQRGETVSQITARTLLLIFSEKTLTFRVGSRLVAETPYTVNANVTPATIDMTFQGQVTTGIYQRKGDDLRICLNEAGKGRPKAIPATFGSGCDVDIQLRRASLQWFTLHVMNPDGTHQRVLVNDPEFTSDGSPEWSWDSRKLAFDAWRSIRGETYVDCHLFTVNAYGTGLKDLGLGAMPSWSPDGKRLAFSCYQPSNAVWTMNADGTGRELLDAAGWGAEWCPKGNKIAYTVYGGSANIRVRDLEQGTSRELLDDRYRQVEWGMAWSPDGQWLAFKGVTTTGKTEAAVVHVEGMEKGFRVLLPAAFPDLKNIRAPLSWSPDSKQVLAILVTKSNPVPHLFLVDAEGKAPAKQLPGQNPQTPYTNIAWSPDGKQIAYCAPAGETPAPKAGTQTGREAAPGPKKKTGAGAAVFKDDPAAHALYDRMIEAMRKAKSLSYVSRYQWEAKGRTLGECEYRVWLKKPNYFRVEAEPRGKIAWLSWIIPGAKGGTLIGDGKDLWIYWTGGRPKFSVEEDEAYEKTQFKSYVTKPAGPGRHSIGHETGLLGAGMSMPILDPSTFHGYTDSLQPYIDGVTSLGVEKVGSEECDRIEVSIMKHQRSWYLWLSRRDHLPRKLQEIVRVSYDIVINEEWSSVTLDADIPDSMFAWKPPDDWVSWKLPEPEERLLKPGAAAPDFELASADGTPIRLSDYRGQVVWLYIWRAG